MLSAYDVEKATVLDQDYGLDLIMEQNELTSFDIICYLIENGDIDLDDYFYTDIPKEMIDEED